MLRKIALLSGVVLLAACSNGSFTLSSEPTQFLTRGLNDAKNGVLLAADGHIAIRICMNIGGDSNEYWSCRDHQLSLPTGKLEHAKKTHYLASSSEASKATGIPDVKEAITGFRIETSGGSFEFESKRLIGFKDFETEGGKATKPVIAECNGSFIFSPERTSTLVGDRCFIEYLKGKEAPKHT